MSQAPPFPSPHDTAHYKNAAEWMDALGHVPLERIVFDPWPGTATEEDVLRLDDDEDRLCELVEGTLVEKTTGNEESAIAMLIGHLLLNYVLPRKLGLASGPDGMMRILRRLVRIPDVAFVSAARLPNGGMPAKAIPELVPDLAVEVLSESNTRNEMAIKLAEYFEAGTRLVWYVDPVSRCVDVYTSAGTPSRLGEKDLLTGGDVLPGFEVRVAEIFPSV